MTEFKYQEDTS